MNQITSRANLYPYKQYSGNDPVSYNSGKWLESQSGLSGQHLEIQYEALGGRGGTAPTHS
jgi:hypothetical protein